MLHDVLLETIIFIIIHPSKERVVMHGANLENQLCSRLWLSSLIPKMNECKRTHAQVNLTLEVDILKDLE